MKIRFASIYFQILFFLLYSLLTQADEAKQWPLFVPPSFQEQPTHDNFHGCKPQDGMLCSSRERENSALHDLRSSLSTMQDQYFSLWLGKWTTAIDWTGAVLGTYVSATLSSISHSLEYITAKILNDIYEPGVKAHLLENEINKYFGHSVSYYFGEDHFAIRMQAYDDILWVVLGWLEATQFIERHSKRYHTLPWHGHQFIPAFAHRARLFYELSEEGWDDRLCSGGMTWNPRLLPYKNAITNELFISASIAMYLYFPGDDNCSPFIQSDDKLELKGLDTYCDEDIPGRYSDKYLDNAIKGYSWLKKVEMTNAGGLYVDGYHIPGYKEDHSRTICDERNEMVYTYNQGVILSGLRGLWEATGNTTYLTDGHELIQNVIKATGWKQKHHDHKPKTQLGTNGILEEHCDPSGTCSQDSQTFKGIFFHHLTTFCAPLPRTPIKRGKTHAATKETAFLHHSSCDGYAAWVTHNAQAALSTRDQAGRFGSWWGTTNDKENKRGRGRTVETQGSGLAVVRAQWEFLRYMEKGTDVV